MFKKLAKKAGFDYEIDRYLEVQVLMLPGHPTYLMKPSRHVEKRCYSPLRLSVVPSV